MIQEFNAQQYALKIRNIKKSFNNKKVLDGIDLNIPTGCIFSILGKSGAGKSVLLKCIMNILKADSGDIWYKHHNLGNIQNKDLYILEKFSYLFQDAALFDFMTVEENIAFPLREIKKIKNNSIIKTRVKELLEWVELSGIEKNMPSELSGGMKKRIGLARALAIDPEVMLCDEPTTGLDPSTGMAIMKLIQKTNQNLKCTCIIITHDIVASFKASHYFVCLDKGKIRAEGTKENFMRSTYPLVQEFISQSFIKKEQVL